MRVSTRELTKKDLGQYFTPAEVVDFTLKMAGEIGGPSLNKGARVLDPACGAGAFLLSALDKGIGSPATIFGIDIDPKVREAWERNTLAENLARNLYIQNGLYDPDDNRVSEKLPLRQFDLVVGNPPYGGFGVREVEKDKRLFNSLKTYELWRLGTRANDDQNSLFDVDVLERLRRLTPKEVERLERFPIEILFLERFIRLAKAGGVIAIVIPDGILANVKFDYVRGWVAGRCHVVAVVSLPRGTFRGAGTTAKTSILFLRKKGAKACGPKHVFMGQLDEGKDGGPPDKEEFDFVLKKFRDKFKGYASGSPIIWTSTTTDDLWNNRWDADYWDPTFIKPIEKIREKFECVEFGALIKEGVSGFRGKTEYAKKGIRFLEVRCIRDLGIDFKEGRFVKKGGNFDKPQYRIEEGDILIVRSGVASAGRVMAVTYIPEKTVICGDIYKVKIYNRCSPYYLAILMQTKVGLLQMERAKAGIASTKLDVVDIKRFIIPIPPKRFQNLIARDYRIIFSEHSKAMNRKHELSSARGYRDDPIFIKNLNLAQKSMKKLITKLDNYFFPE